jgi:SPP1 family predicted phage head-tail adaptor
MILNHTLTIRRATASTRNERGEPTETYADLATVAASVQPISARELEQLGQGGPVASTHKVYLYPIAITADDRLVEGSTTYEIDAVFDQAGAGHHLRLNVHSVAV